MGGAYGGCGYSTPWRTHCSRLSPAFLGWKRIDDRGLPLASGCVDHVTFFQTPFWGPDLITSLAPLTAYVPLSFSTRYFVADTIVSGAAKNPLGNRQS